MKYIIIITLVLLSSIALADPQFYYKKDSSVDLKVPCINDGAACSDAATCNVTINYPNSTSFVDNQLMTNGGTYHNYTLSDTSVTGEYACTVFCDDGGTTGYSTFSFVINASGNEDNQFQILAVYGILLGLVAVYIFAGFKISPVHIAAKIVLFLGGLINLLAVVMVAYIDMVTAYNTPNLMLYIFEGNSVIVIAVIALFFISTMKRAANMEEDRNDRI
jgi:hypothetical protein